MFDAYCHCCKTLRYEIDNNQWRGELSEYAAVSSVYAYDLAELKKTDWYYEQMLLAIVEKAIQKNIIIKKLTVKIEYKERKKCNVSVYCIMAYDFKEGISSYWVRKIKYNDLWKPLLSYDFLGSIFREFEYMNSLPWKLVKNLSGDKYETKNHDYETTIYAFSPECVSILEGMTDLSVDLIPLRKKLDEFEKIVKVIKNGIYITRLLAHTERDEKLSFYCGTSFQIKCGERVSIFRNVNITIPKHIAIEHVYCSQDSCQLEDKKYPWMILEVNKWKKENKQ